MTIEPLHSAIKTIASRLPQSPAILSLERQPLTYQRLDELISKVINSLNTLGIGRGDVVALVLPNGPQAASAFVSVASAATCAPLNPAYTAAEFDFYLSDLNAKALVVQAGVPSPALDVARARGIPVLMLTLPEGEPAGFFTLSGESKSSPSHPGPAQSEDVALILHTSGTTSRPKIVPLTQHNLCASATNIARTLHLSQADRCLNIMPLFHIHGLMAAVLASLSCGASVACTPGFLAPEFFKWMEFFRPSWYSAVPSMHQSILSRASAHSQVIKAIPLRFIRSSSSSLPPSVMAALEQTFAAPVIEAYGMTEASHQMTSNPLPPAARKPGSVGQPTGIKIAIMDENSAGIKPVGASGEIVICGDSVTGGYANNPEANARAFTDGWFRTGDQGHLDSDGYLFITGRLKEIINRGGEKISPREIDEVLLEHPAVVQAVTFGIPDASLGEDVACAVVLKDRSVSENDLRKYAAGRLSYFKVPQRVIILDEIPKGATGKIQRIGLAQKLGLTAETPATSVQSTGFTAPGSEVEKNIAEIWQKVLDLPVVGLHEPFKDLGGDSMLATVIHMLLEEKFGVQLTLLDVFSAATVTDQAALIETSSKQV